MSYSTVSIVKSKIELVILGQLVTVRAYTALHLRIVYMYSTHLFHSEDWGLHGRKSRGKGDESYRI